MSDGLEDWHEISEPARLTPDPLVSTLILAYNHGAHLAAALDGALMQQAAFPVEIVISDDFSTDDTRAVALRYQRAHPSTIRIVTADRNVGALQSLHRLFLAARGEFVAICEGDDYWIAEDKLARQVAVMKKRPELSLCFHAAQVFDEAQQRVVGATKTAPSPVDYSLSEIIAGGGGMVPTPSMMVRASALPPMDEWFLAAPVGDYPIAIWAASRGVVHSMPEAMAVYRVGDRTSWTSRVSTDVLQDWRHTLGAIRMLQALPDRAGRPDALPAVQRAVRRYLRDFAAQHGAVAMRRLPGYQEHARQLTIRDRLFLIAFNDPASLRMRAAWFWVSRWRRIRRVFAATAAATPPDR